MKPVYFATLMLVLSGITIAFCFICYEYYGKSDKIEDIANISDNWEYTAYGGEIHKLSNLRYAVKIPPNKTLTLYKNLDVKIENAALFIKANHQTISIYLDEQKIFESGVHDPSKNPGMEFFFVELPDNYMHKLLTIEIISPYQNYSGRVSSIFLGAPECLETYAIALSMRSVVLMVLCLFLSVCTIALTVMQAVYNVVDLKNLSIGLFAFLLGFYYVCTEYIFYKILTPLQMTAFSIGCYFSWQIPLVLFFYFSFKAYKKWLFPALLWHLGFPICAYILHALGIRQFPEFLIFNNAGYVFGFLYIIVLSLLEVLKRNRFMMVVTPFLIFAYVSLMRAFYTFYFTNEPVNYNIYRDTFAMLIVVVLIYNTVSFFRKQYRPSLSRKPDAATKSSRGENVVIDTLLEQLQTTAKEKNILLNCKVDTPERLNISDSDLFGLITNIIENAVEICENTQTTKFIDFDMHTEPPCLHILLTNSKSHEIIETGDGNIPNSTKYGGDAKGFGLWTVAQIVKKHGGTFDISHDKDTFTIDIAISQH